MRDNTTSLSSAIAAFKSPLLEWSQRKPLMVEVAENLESMSLAKASEIVFGKPQEHSASDENITRRNGNAQKDPIFETEKSTNHSAIYRTSVARAGNATIDRIYRALRPLFDAKLSQQEICRRLDAAGVPLPPQSSWRDYRRWHQAYLKDRGSVTKWLSVAKRRLNPQL